MLKKTLLDATKRQNTTLNVDLRKANQEIEFAQGDILMLQERFDAASEELRSTHVDLETTLTTLETTRTNLQIVTVNAEATQQTLETLLLERHQQLTDTRRVLALLNNRYD